MDRFDIEIWRSELKGYLDVDYVIDGLTYGFHIGIDPDKDDIDEKLLNHKLNIHLTNKQKKAITDWFKIGCLKGYIVGPFDKNFKFPWPLHISPLFVVPKPLKNEYRPICHLSFKKYPWNYSVNDLLSEDEKHVQYVRFKEIVEMMENAGRYAYMWTVDAQE